MSALLQDKIAVISWADGVVVVSGIFAIPQLSSGVTKRPVGVQPGRFVTALRGYVYGPENLLLHEALATVTTHWGRFSPLVITGASGLGKTLLLASLVSTAQDQFPELDVHQLTGTDYARAIAHAIDVDSIADLRSRHRAADLFVLDGLQEVAHKAAVQCELLHTLDALWEHDAQVIVSLRGVWDQSSGLLPGLISRLSAGLVISLQSPGRETLIDIGRRYVAGLPVTKGEHVVAHAVSPTDSRSSPCRTVPELQAAIKQAALSSELDGTSEQEGNTTKTSACLEQGCAEITAKLILQRVAKCFHLSLRDLTGSSRRKTVVQARCMATFLMRTRLQLSFQRIGQQLGSRDHTTIMNAFERAGRLLKQDPGFRHATADLLVTLQ